MQVPPYSDPPKKNNSTLIILIVIGVIGIGGCAVVAIGAALLFPVFSQARQAAKDTRSLSNIKQINMALQAYTVGADDRLPPASCWETALLDTRAVRDATIFEDPNLAVGGAQVHGYAMNQATSGIELTKVPEPHRLVVPFASTVLQANASGGKGDVRLTKRGRAVVGFADGSCQLTRAEDVDALQWSPK